MYKLILKTVFLAVTGLVGLSLMMWGLNHSELAVLVLPKTLINSLYAEASASAQTELEAEENAVGTPTLPSASLSHLAKTYLRDSPVSRHAPVAGVAVQNLPALGARGTERVWRMTVSFAPSEVSLSETELAKLQETLQKIKLKRNSKVWVITGRTHSENTMAPAQTEKLRAQTVARLIFPYTQEVSIHFQHTSLEAGKVAIEFMDAPFAP